MSTSGSLSAILCLGSCLALSWADCEVYTKSFNLDISIVYKNCWRVDSETAESESHGHFMVTVIFPIDVCHEKEFEA